jgi:hypothetical protein
VNIKDAHHSVEFAGSKTQTRNPKPMPFTTPDQRGQNLRKNYLRHYHKTAQTTTLFDQKSRRDIEIIQRRQRARLMKWSAISLLLISLTLAGMLFFSERL